VRVRVLARYFPYVINADDAIRYKRRLWHGLASLLLPPGSFAPGHRYLEDAPTASLSASSKIVFQTDRKAGGHRRELRECGGGVRASHRLDDVRSVCKTRRRVDPTPSAPVGSLSNPPLSLSLSLSLSPDPSSSSPFLARARDFPSDFSLPLSFSLSLPPLSLSLFLFVAHPRSGDPSGLPVTLASTTISTGERRYSVSVLVAAEPAAPIHR